MVWAGGEMGERLLPDSLDAVIHRGLGTAAPLPYFLAGKAVQRVLTDDFYHLTAYRL